MKNFFIIGSSRGLGAALVEELLENNTYRIFGIARTKFENIENYNKLVISKRYHHIEIDVVSPRFSENLKKICSEHIKNESICVVYNAAHIEKDVNSDCSINYDAFVNVNKVGIDGFCNVLKGFEAHLLTYGGILVGISSFWGITPPLFLPWVAYPSSKAYLNMTLKCLRAAWDKKVKIVTVHLGNVGGNGVNPFSRFIVPTYLMVAKKIVASIVSKKPPKNINYPQWHSIVYRYIIKLIPDSFYLKLFQIYFKVEYLLKITKK
jgi:NAD(P)-dependent dehydrogenase (short-subunit alcohol dehydrogenase family)